MESLHRFSQRRGHATWAGTFRCAPQLYIEPTCLKEVKLAVQEAKRLGKTIMVVGSGHSPSTLTMTNEWLMNLDRFNSIVDITRYDGYTDVKVEAGARIFQLNEQLAAKGLALQNLGSISDQSVAGIFSTGTHGSSLYHGLVSQQLVDITLLCANGELVTCSAHQDPDLFRALMLGLGKFGVIVYVTIRTVPAFTLATKQEAIPFSTVVSPTMWATLWKKSEFARVWWFPYSEHCIVWHADKSEHEISSRRRFSFYETALGRFCYQAMLWVAVKFVPSLTVVIEQWVFRKQYLEYPQKEVYYERSDRALNMDCLFSQFVNEWGIPLSKGQQVLDELDKLIKAAAKTGDFYVHAPIEVRVSNTVDLQARHCIPGNTLRPLLDPTCPTEPTLYINATMYRPFGYNYSVETWYKHFEAVMKKAGGRPHWAKNYLVQDDTAMASWYGEDAQLWSKLRQQYDPSGVFLSGKDWISQNNLF